MSKPTNLPGWQSCHAGKHFLTMAEVGLPCVMCRAERTPGTVQDTISDMTEWLRVWDATNGYSPARDQIEEWRDELVAATR